MLQGKDNDTNKKLDKYDEYVCIVPSNIFHPTIEWCKVGEMSDKIFS